MMKTIHLAAYMEPENHGPGRKIAITDSKPMTFDVDAVFPPFIPDQDLLQKYKETQLEDQKKAAELFVTNYKSSLDDFFDQAKKDAEEQSKDITDLLPFNDGDTLLCWERRGYTSYRTILAEYLKDAGYNVELK